MSSQVHPIQVRVVKCRFGPIFSRYNRGEWHDIDDKINTRKGVFAGLDRSHSGDFKVGYVSDPVLGIHSSADVSHEELEEKLKEIGVWSDHLIPVDLPVTESDGSMGWKAGFKTLPRESGRLDFYKHQLEEANDDDYPAIESRNTMKVTV